MDCTYKAVPPNTLKFKLMIIRGIDLHENVFNVSGAIGTQYYIG